MGSTRSTTSSLVLKHNHLHLGAMSTCITTKNYCRQNIKTLGAHLPKNQQQQHQQRQRICLKSKFATVCCKPFHHHRIFSSNDTFILRCTKNSPSPIHIFENSNIQRRRESNSSNRIHVSIHTIAMHFTAQTPPGSEFAQSFSVSLFHVLAPSPSLGQFSVLTFGSLARRDEYCIVCVVRVDDMKINGTRPIC